MNEAKDKTKTMSAWFWYAIGAAVLYGLHQVFTKMAADRIGDGLGGFVVEASAALTILAYLAWLYFSGRWKQSFRSGGRDLLGAHGNLRWGGYGVLLCAFSKGRTVVSGADDSGRRRGFDGGGGHSGFSRAGIMAAIAGDCPGSRRTLFVAQLIGPQALHGAIMFKRFGQIFLSERRTAGEENFEFRISNFELGSAA